MQILNSQDSNFRALLEARLSQSRGDVSNISGVVSNIINNVVRSKDEALIKLTHDFDNVSLTSAELMFSENEINDFNKKVSNKEKAAVNTAAKRIREFHLQQIPSDRYWTDSAGVEMGWRWQPIERVGIYVPGGTASYPSSVLMNAIPAKIAGAREIIMVSPIPNGRINPLVIYAAKISGVDRIYKIGGAQAIAALAYGTESVSPVDKIVGPGNAFVAEAKRQVFGRVGIDMVAGPSEVLIIADGDNNPEWVAADLLSQAEHDKSAQSILITTSKDLANKVVIALDKQLLKLGRKKIAEESWKKYGIIIVVDSLRDAAILSNTFAPEHLQLCVADPETLLNSISNAGSVFLGPWTPEAIGDYIIGTNHVLPTGKTARFSSGLSVLDFMKRSLISKVTPRSLQAIGETAVTLAKAEGLGAHELSLKLRIDEYKKIFSDDQ